MASNPPIVFFDELGSRGVTRVGIKVENNPELYDVYSLFSGNLFRKESPLPKNITILFSGKELDTWCDEVFTSGGNV